MCAQEASFIVDNKSICPLDKDIFWVQVELFFWLLQKNLPQ